MEAYSPRTVTEENSPGPQKPLTSLGWTTTACLRSLEKAEQIPKWGFLISLRYLIEATGPEWIIVVIRWKAMNSTILFISISKISYWTERNSFKWQTLKVLQPFLDEMSSSCDSGRNASAGHQSWPGSAWVKSRRVLLRHDRLRPGRRSNRLGRHRDEQSCTQPSRLRQRSHERASNLQLWIVCLGQSPGTWRHLSENEDINYLSAAR